GPYGSEARASLIGADSQEDRPRLISMNQNEAYAVLSAGHPSFPKFFGAVDQLDAGVGLILNHVAYPVYNDDDADWDIAEGLVYVVSHECDIAPENDRPFNEAALVCPIIP